MQSAHEAAGAARIRRSPRPPMGEGFSKALGASRRECEVVCGLAVIPGWSEGPDPESRDSGFDASHRPGMTAMGLRAV